MRRHLPKVEDMEHREAEDLDVAQYYITTGNFKASYARAQDALKIAPEDPEAHLALAEAAQHLKKNGEAISEYTIYLKLDPDGPKAHTARKALASLTLK